MVVADVSSKKKPLQGHLPDLYLVKPLHAMIEKERSETDIRRLDRLVLIID